MSLIESLSEFYTNYAWFLWILGILIPSVISAVIPKIRRKFKTLFFRMILKIQGNDVGINAVYLKNYLEPPQGKMNNDIFDQIKNEISYDKIDKVSMHPRFLKIRSNKLGMKLIISIEKEYLEIEDEELQSIPYNVTIEMDADIKGTSNIHNLDDFVTISEKIQEIIRTKLFPNAEVGQSYVVCTVNNILNDVSIDNEKKFEFEDNQITMSGNTTTILSHTPRNLTQILKKYVYA
ncbi:hypothetical protein [Nitrosopumilus sp.]|uniref:hypothetical protein n=1 Tax=Nitrosopumilus sp. TaxID=2024843 RepID=UPI00247D39FA|nr:hypothetical protein [Nitrosopumilus sp.]MCV0431677.1 hypothetical protein [Nitrosopumilus sp.]